MDIVEFKTIMYVMTLFQLAMLVLVFEGLWEIRRQKRQSTGWFYTYSGLLLAVICAIVEIVALLAWRNI